MAETASSSNAFPHRRAEGGGEAAEGQLKRAQIKNRASKETRDVIKNKTNKALCKHLSFVMTEQKGVCVCVWVGGWVYALEQKAILGGVIK